MDGHQGLLHKVLHIAGLGLQALIQKAAQVATEHRQRTLIAGAVSVQRPHPQAVQLGFDGVQAFAHALNS